MISRHDQGTETEAPATFHHFRAAIDEDDLLGCVTSCGRSSVGVAFGSSTLVLLCHELKFQTAFAGCVGQGFHLAVINVSTAVEDHGLCLFSKKTLSDSLPNDFCIGPVSACFRLAEQAGFFG